MASSWLPTQIGLLSVLLCGGLAAEYGWVPQKHYTFSVEGQDLVGLPQLKLQYAGFRYSGEVHVQSHSPRILLIQIGNMNYTNIHEELSEGWWKGPQSSLTNRTKIFPLTPTTILVKLTRSTSPQLVVQSGLDDWEMNFIKGLVSNILTYIGQRTSSSESNSYQAPTNSQQKDTFSVIEDSVVGRCEVLYEVTPLPRYMASHSSNSLNLCDDKEPLWEITKTGNYSNCQVLSEDHVHLPTKDCTPGGARCGNFWSRASLTQIIGCGEKNKFLLLSSVTSSTVNTELHLQSNSQAVVNSMFNITLLSLNNIEKKFSPPQENQTLKSLLYSYSTSPKEKADNSEEESNVPQGKGNKFNKIEPTEDGEDISGSVKMRVKELRKKRGIKSKKGNNDQTESSKRYNDNDYRNSYLSNNQQAYDANSDNYKKPKNTEKPSFHDETIEESGDQPSEELQLEDLWKISGKESKNIPPHQPFNMFTLAHRTSYDLSCLNPKLRQIIADITSDLGSEDINSVPEKNTMDKLSLAVDICRSLPLDQLTSVSDDVFDIHSGTTDTMKNKEWKVFRDVVAMCGTHPALQLIRGWVERQQVEGEDAAELIASLPSYIFSPNKYLLQDFFEMVQYIAGKSDEKMTITAVLAMSNLVRDACINQASRQHHFSSIITPVCEKRFATHFTEWVIQQFNADSTMKRVYIEALGNIGSPDIISFLKDIALNPKHSSYLQTSAVFAMRYQVLKKNQYMSSLLMSLFHNYSLPVSTRIAAAALLVYSRPGLAVWQRLAISTWYEPSSAVAQFVTSSLRSTATTHDTLYNQLTKSAFLVKPLTRPSKINSNWPYNLLTSWVSSDLENIVLEQLSWTEIYDFTSLYYRHTSRFAGYSRTNVEASFVAANPDDLWTALKELVMSSYEENKREPLMKGFERTIRKIQESLELQPRSMPKLQAELHLKVTNIMERLLIFDKDTLKSWAKGGRKAVSEIMREGKSLSYQKADMNDFHISTTTELGFPLEFSVRTPQVIQARVDFNVSDGELRIGTFFMYSAQLLSSVSVMSPWDNIAHSAGAYAVNFLQLPAFRVIASLDQATGILKVMTTHIEQRRLLYTAMQPFTSQRRLKIHQPTLLSPDTLKVRLQPPVQTPIPWLTRFLSTVYSSEEEEYFNPMDFLQQARLVLGFPMMMSNMGARSFEIILNQFNPTIMNYSMKLASQSMGLLEIESPRDTVIGKIFNAITKTETFDNTPDGQSKVLKNTNTEQEVSQDVNITASSTVNPTDTDNIEDYSKPVTDKSSTSTNPIVLAASESYIEEHKVYPTTYSSPTGTFNASTVDPFVNAVNGSTYLYLIQQALSNIESGKAVVIGVNLWYNSKNPPSMHTAYAAYSTSLSERISRIGLFLKNEITQIKLTSAFEAPEDIATNLKEHVSRDLKHSIYLDYVRKTNGQDMTAYVKASLGMSRERLNQLRVSPFLGSCSQMSPQHFDGAIDKKCQEMQAQARQIGQANITIYYNELFKNLPKIAEIYMNTAKVLLPRTEEEAGEGFNSVSAMLDVDHATESVSARITTPASSLKIYKLPLSQTPMPNIAKLALQESTTEEFCGLSSHRVRTFDGAELQHKMKNNWYLVTHDCSKKYNFSVIARPVGNSSLIVEVNIDDSVVIAMDEGPKVSLNGQPQPLDTSHPLLLVSDSNGRIIAHTVHTPDNSIHIQLPGSQLDLVYSGTSIIIRAKSGVQGRLCGLCGAFYNSGVEHFLTPHGSSALQPAEFYQSHMFKGSKSFHA